MEPITNSKGAHQAEYDQYAKAWESDGRTQKLYCEQLGINYVKFVHARSRLRSNGVHAATHLDDKHKPTFIQINKLNSQASIKSADDDISQIQIQMTNGTRLMLPVTLQPAQLSAIFTILSTSI